MKRIDLIIPEEISGMRADRALARLLPEIPEGRLRDAFRQKDVKQNGTRIAPDQKVRSGDAMRVFLPDEWKAAHSLSIALEDDEYLIVNKRQGIPVQGAGSVEALCAAQIGAPVYACHRLDVQTGGLLLLAKTEKALAAAREALARREIHRVYRALVFGRPEKESDTLKAHLKKDAKEARVRIADTSRAGYAPIETRYRLLRAEGDVSLLEVELVTGKTHQIRAHLAHIGLPILGDDKYGDRAANRAHGKRKQCLWAVRLTLWDGRGAEAREEF